MTQDLEPWEIDIVKDKFLRDVNQKFAEILPKVFPHEARVVHISGDELYIEVSDYRYKNSIKGASKTFISILNDIGLKKVTRIKTQYKKDFVRLKPMKGILDIVAKTSHKKDAPPELALAKPILEKAERLHKFNKLFSDSFGSPFPDHAQIVNMKDGIITISVTSSVQATKIRLMSQKICDVCAQLGIEHIRQVKVSVSTQSTFNPLDLVKSPTQNEKSMSSEAAKALSQAAEYIGDKDLSDALKKLANKNKKEK